jgi:glucosamine kinase
MILIADSGSTKTSWFYSDNGNHSEYFSTTGINPFFRNSEDIAADLQENLLPKLEGTVTEIYFYGAGIINEEKGAIVKSALAKLFPSAQINVWSDLLAAARSTLGDKSGIACILGTGSNSCLYDGSRIIKNVSPLGYILGDEGSGAVLGRKLLGDFLKGILPDQLSAKFQKRYPLSYSEFLESVYKKEKPNKFLAEFVPFLSKNLNETYCSDLVKNAFEDFIQRNVLQYPACEKVPIGFVGSVAYYFQDQLKSVLSKNNLNMGEIVKNPLEGLIEYHR